MQVVVQGERSGRSERTVDPQLLKMALAPHPKLRAALFPAGPRGNSPSSDISVYHLLQVHSHLSRVHPVIMLVLMSALFYSAKARQLHLSMSVVLFMSVDCVYVVVKLKAHY